MSYRDALKNIVKFGKREYSEKKPLNLKVFRVKSKSILTRGMLPSLNITQIRATQFIIIADYGEYIRIYSFSKDAQLLGGENIDKNPQFMKSLLKSTTLQYHLPKEKPKLTINHITKHYQTEFNKILQRMNQIYGFNLKIPYTIIAHNDLKLRMGRMIGCAKTKNEEKLVISVEAYKKDFFEAIITREIMYLYLRDLIVMFQEVEGNIVYWYDLAILFTNFYLKNEKKDYFINIMEKTTISFLNFEDGNKFYFSDKIIEVLKKNTKIYTTKEVNVLFSNIFDCLKLLKEYKIRFRYKEFANFFFDLCELFLNQKENNLLKPTIKLKYYNFHYRHFQKTLEMDKHSKKIRFLHLMFGLLSNNPPKEDLLSNLIQNIKFLIEDDIIQKEIVNYKKLVDDAIFAYILDDVIKVGCKYEVKNKHIEVSIIIENTSKLIFKNFTYDISWKPKNRLTLISTEEGLTPIDLNKGTSRIYNFSSQTQGNITILCTIGFSNLFEPQKRMKKVLNLARINVKI